MVSSLTPLSSAEHFEHLVAKFYVNKNFTIHDIQRLPWISLSVPRNADTSIKGTSIEIHAKVNPDKIFQDTSNGCWMLFDHHVILSILLPYNWSCLQGKL